MLPEGWVQLTDEQLDELDKRDTYRLVMKHKYFEDRTKSWLRREAGASDVLTIPADRCIIVGHRWLPERLLTRRCSVCNLWEAL